MTLAHGAADHSVAILRLRVVEGDAAVYPTGTRTVRPFTIQVTDETGRPVEGAAVSILLPNDGATGMFNGNMRSDIVTTGADGRATAGSIQWNRTPGAVSIRVTVSKSEVRAGTLISQYLTDSPAVAARSAAQGRSRWLTTGLIIGGAGAGALAVALVRSPASGVAGTSTPAGGTSISIGTPSIIIGRP
ncbi:MAG TPA: hypothetical protein VFL57_10185 [Bryobacteraceae bacterium]|nr:hypothetical protein [Bryobacteraceae bacterium]